MQMFIFTPFVLLPMWHLKKRFGNKASMAYFCSILTASLIWILTYCLVKGFSSSAFIWE